MSKLLGFLGLTIGGWVGWGIGLRLSFVVAFFLSIIGSGLGLYIGRRIAHTYY